MKSPSHRLLSATLLACLFVSVPLRAQHGGAGPSEMKPLPVTEKPAVVSFAEGVKEDAALKAFFGEFAEALRTHDGKPFVPRLADNYTVPGYETKDMKTAFVKAMTMIMSPEEIIITAIEPQAGGGKLVKTGFKFPKRTAKREFTLSADNKLVITSLISMVRPAGSVTPSH